ncbi:MAG: peptidoglycan DD-metalloendopeptidase family protein [Fimbriimonadaceae bacterium]|nr:peptidoglycan DD-metalloendopeptidase family protein [Fimbriimonadaceae bacterium]
MKRLTLLFTVFALVGVLLAIAAAQQKPTPTKSTPSASEGELKNDLNRLENKRTEASRELNRTRKAVRAVRGDINQIDNRLGKLEDDLSYTVNSLNKGISEQARLKKELEQATVELGNTKEKLRSRLKWMYMHGDAAAVSVLAKAKNFGDFASRSYTIKRIAAADRRLFEDYKDLQASITKKKQRQDQLVVEVRDLKSRQESQQVDLKSARNDKAYVLGELRDKQQDLEKLVRQLDAEAASITAQINAYNNSSGRTNNLQPFKGKFSSPVAGRVTSGYGMRHHPILKRNRLHAGIDYGAKSGTPIKAAADGVVITSQYSNGYGNMVVIDHGGNISTLYGHCSKVYVKAGQKVSRGEKIAAVGSTGLATGPHLHFEVRVNGKPVNPAGWL